MWLGEFLMQDRAANRGNSKALLVLPLFRLAHYLACGPPWRAILGKPYLLFYRVAVEWLFCIEIQPRTVIGKGLRLYHGQALVVNEHTIIGVNCTLRSSTTIGNKVLRDGTLSGCPRIGQNVDIGANVVIVGDVIIGDNAIIGAGSVVVKNVPSDVVACGNPAHVVRHLTEIQR